MYTMYTINTMKLKCDHITIRDMLFDVENGKIEEAVVPENSLEGSVNEISDIMANEVDLKYKLKWLL